MQQNKQLWWIRNIVELVNSELKKNGAYILSDEEKHHGKSNFTGSRESESESCWAKAHKLLRNWQALHYQKERA